MGIIRTICLWILVALLCVSFTFSLDYSKFGEDQLVDSASGEIDENLAELLWISCRQELNDINEALEDLNSHLPREALHPELQQVLSDCIRKNNNLFQVSGEDSGFKTLYSRYFESLFHWHEVPRRALATQSIAIAPAPNVGPSPAPAPTSESPRLSPESLPSPPLPLPVPSIQAAPPINDLSDIISPANRDPTHGGTDNSRIIVIACVVTAVVISVFVALFFFLYCRRGSAAKQNDERPLLSLSLNELSCGSSHAYAFGTNDSSIHEKASTNGNVHIESNAHQISFNGKSSFGAVAATTKASAAFPDKPRNNNPLLPLPPGRVGASRPGLPPLKSLPDRADPLPPEPPAPIRASPTPPPPMKPASVTMGPRPPPPPMPPGGKPGPCPPPPPNGAFAPPRPPPPMPFGSKLPPRPPSGPQRTPNAIYGEGSGSADDANAPKAKLKPFFWDKVAANPDQSMVWNQIKSGSFQFNEELIETLFGSVDKNKNDRKKETSTQESVPQYIQLIDPKKAQNLAILLRALNVTTEEVCDALCEGNKLPVELLQTLLKMAPTADEELKLKMFNGEISQLGPAERFLKVLVDIPFAFKRMEVLLFMCSLYEEVTSTRESFQTLEIACKELRSSRLFLKLLEAVLKTGNRMNDGTFRGGAQAFKLDTLLKLSDVKGVDGKTTLLHFVVQEIIRTEGMRAARAARENKSDIGIKSDDLLQDVSPDTEEHYHSLGLQVVSCLSSELENVKKAAATDADTLTGTVAKLGHGLVKARDFLNLEMKNAEEESGFHQTLRSFVQKAEVDVMSLLKEEKRIMALVKSTGDYFHGNAHKDEGLRLFVIIRDVLIILDKVCKEIKIPPRKPVKEYKKNVSNALSSSSESRLASTSPDPQQKLFSAIAERRMDNFSSSSDDES